MRKQKRWHRLGKSYSLKFPESDYNKKYLYHSFLEFLMSISLVCSPQNAKMFRQYKDNYLTGAWSIDKDENFDQVLNSIGLTEKKNSMCADLYQFAFGEMPMILGVSKNQLAYKRGDPESMEEISRKKAFINKPFTQFNEIEKFTKGLIDKYISDSRNL